MEKNEILHLHNKRSNIISLVGYGLSVGLVVGLLISVYRVLVSKLQPVFLNLYRQASSSITSLIFLSLILVVFGLIVGILTQKEPKIGGSGIPQVTGQLNDMMTINWRPVLVYKFVGGLIGLISGLTVGREGPSVQMGACVGQAVSDIFKKDSKSQKLFITAGAAAGLSAAFNAPISGIFFVLEELHRKFDKGVFLIAMFASLIADNISALIFGIRPVIDIGIIENLSVGLYPHLLVLGILIGFMSIIFIKGIYYGKLIYNKFNIPVFVKVLISFIISGLFIIMNIDLFASGEKFIFISLGDSFKYIDIINILILKFILLLVAFCSGMPGGIFLPMLVFGSLIGTGFGLILSLLGVISSDLIIVFALISMAANFAAIVRSPLTAIMLLLELTGSFTFFLPVGIVVITAYTVVELLNIKPIYEVLLEMQLES